MAREVASSWRITRSIAAPTRMERKAKLTPTRVQLRIRWGSRSAAIPGSGSVPRAASAPTTKNAATDRAIASSPWARPRKMTAKTLVPRRTTPEPELNPKVVRERTPAPNASTMAAVARATTEGQGSRRSAGKASPPATNSATFGQPCRADGDDSAIAATIGAMTAATVNIPRSTSRRQDAMSSTGSSRGRPGARPIVSSGWGSFCRRDRIASVGEEATVSARAARVERRRAPRGAARTQRRRTRGAHFIPSPLG